MTTIIAISILVINVIILACMTLTITDRPHRPKPVNPETYPAKTSLCLALIIVSACMTIFGIGIIIGGALDGDDTGNTVKEELSIPENDSYNPIVQLRNLDTSYIDLKTNNK